MTAGWRWLRNRQTGPVPRLGLVAQVLTSSIKHRGPWRSLPIDIATALFAPIRKPSMSAPPVPIRDWSPERMGAASRLRQAAEQWASSATKPLAVASIADDDALEAWARSGRVLELRPEDWALVLERSAAAGDLPDAFLLTSTNNGNHGAWAFRLGQVAHPDAFLHRDLSAIIGWFADRNLPSIFLVAEDGPNMIAEWGMVACLFDLVLAPTATMAADFTARPDRRGVEAHIGSSAANLDEIRTAVVALA